MSLKDALDQLDSAVAAVETTFASSLAGLKRHAADLRSALHIDDVPADITKQVMVAAPAVEKAEAPEVAKVATDVETAAADVVDAAHEEQDPSRGDPDSRKLS